MKMSLYNLKRALPMNWNGILIGYWRFTMVLLFAFLFLIGKMLLFFFLYEGTFLSSFQSKMRYLCLKVNCHSIPWFLMCPPSHQFLCDGWQLVAGRTLKARERVNKQGQGRNYHFHSPKTDNIFNFCYQTLFISNFTL